MNIIFKAFLIVQISKTHVSLSIISIAKLMCLVSGTYCMFPLICLPLNDRPRDRMVRSWDHRDGTNSKRIYFNSSFPLSLIPPDYLICKDNKIGNQYILPFSCFLNSYAKDNWHSPLECQIIRIIEPLVECIIICPQILTQ